MKTRPAFRWTLDWKSALFTAVLLPVLLSLGFWQLDRAEQKRALQAQYDTWADSEPLSLPAAQDIEHYRPVQLTGHWDPQRYFLLDNRTRNGRVGFEVLGVFVAAGGVYVVNRGWVEGVPDRSRLPRPDFPDGEQHIIGHAYWPEAGWQPAGPVITGEGWPKVSQGPMPGPLSAALGEEVAPYLVRLAPHDAAALVTDWAVVNTQPEKHTGYAVQWFLMAAALLLLFFGRNTNIAAIWAGTNTETTSMDTSNDA